MLCDAKLALPRIDMTFIPFLNTYKSVFAVELPSLADLCAHLGIMVPYDDYKTI